ncbi:MAG: hypothetical protein JWO10_128 [Microbacteriaceae bacterium]|nr:hypothetical protein [Microbacteriaceae bacterium]
MKFAIAIVLPAIVVLGLAGCSASADGPLTVEKSTIANTAAKALQTEWNSSTLPKVDCGTGSTEVAVGKALDCTATDTTSKQELPITITITKVNGSKYSINVKGQQASTPTPTPTPTPTAAGPTLTPGALADLASASMAGQYGFEPTVDCGSTDIVMTVGAVVDCTTLLNDGKTYPAAVTVTSIAGGDYKVDVKVGATPVG